VDGNDVPSRIELVTHMGSLLSWSLILHSLIPERALRQLVKTRIADFEVNLCLHRVSQSTCTGGSPSDTVIGDTELDTLLKLLGCDTPSCGPPKVTASFDDGYADAVEYVQSHHARFPSVNWIFFVCPAKTRDRVGFRWDLKEGEGANEPPLSIDDENCRHDLRQLGDDARCNLATIEQLRLISNLPRVRLGNHTNCHFALSSFDRSTCQRELRKSRHDFEEMFGATDLFAFPFGVRHLHFGPEHVDLVAAEGYHAIYSVEPRPARLSQGGPAEVVPRFAVMGSWPATKVALYIALVAARESTRSARAVFWSRMLRRR
jgi:hypothetical protein